MYCQQCGAEMRTDAKVCSKCGGTIAETPATDQVTDTFASTAEAISRRKSFWEVWSLVIVLLVVLGNGGVICWHMFTSPKLGNTRSNPIAKATQSQYKLGYMRTNPIDNAEMVWVPGGTFTMGSAEGIGYENEHPAHQVTLPGYWIYKYEVTVAQYRVFCAENTSHSLPEFPSPQGSWKGKTGWDDPLLQQHPIVNVTLDDAKAYAYWAKAALPSEAQWEYAARGPEGRNYPWGGIAKEVDWKKGWNKSKCANSTNSRSKGFSTWPVGSFPAGVSWCGAQDLAGNVWEFNADIDEMYSSVSVPYPPSQFMSYDAVLRGGSWYSSGDSCRSSLRLIVSMYYYNVYIGFRCVSLDPGP